MKNFFFLTAIILTFSQSLAFAVLDEDFTGDTLVIGGTTCKLPTKLSVNISGGDIEGSGWDEGFLEKNFTGGKYNHILYEHVGYSLDYCTDEDCGDGEVLANIHFNLLKPGGTFDFLTWGDIFNDSLTFAGYFSDVEPLPSSVKLLLQHSKCQLDYHEVHEGMPSTNTPINMLMLQPNKEWSSSPEDFKDELRYINNDSSVRRTVCALSKAGFKDIRVQFENDGVLGFTHTHHSLHISAKKPE